MRRRVPGSVTTFAVFNFIFGAMFLLCGAMSLSPAKLEVNGRDMSYQFQEFLKDEIPGYMAMRIAEASLDMLIAVGFILGGVGILLLKGWGRILCVVFAGVSICNQLFECYFQLALVNPARTRFFANSLLGLFTGISTPFVVGWALIVIAYSVVMLIMMLQSSTARVFRPDWEGLPDPDDRPRRPRYDDDDFDRPRRRPRDDDDYDDRPRRRSRYEDDDDDDRPRRRSFRRDDDD